jgi:6-phosphogluconolactonase
MEVINFSSSQKFIEAAVLDIAIAAAAAIRDNGSFHIILSGGETPVPVYRQLAKQNFDWSLWHVWFADERAPDPDKSVLNWEIVSAAFLDIAPIPTEQVHRIKTEVGVNKAAVEYNLQLQQIDEFDFVILGLGEDGHTASLFPGIDRKGDETYAAFAVLQSPKPPTHRVTLTGKRLSKTKEVLFLVAGTAKRNAVKAWEEKKEIPAIHIKGRLSTKLYYFENLK